MNTYGGNVGLINANTLPIILDWLARHEVPFDEVVVGKPWCGEGGFYVDDRALRPSEFARTLGHRDRCAPGWRTMIFVTSAAYVSAELQSEFGRLPPTFLPVGNRRLFQWQLKLLRAHFASEAIYVTLPESFAIAKRDLRSLNEWDVEVVRIPDSLTLADSVLFAINTVGRYEEAVRILHGDTWPSSLPEAADCISVDTSADDYDWHIDDRGGDGAEARVWCGYFAFASVRLLARCLVAA